MSYLDPIVEYKKHIKFFVCGICGKKIKGKMYLKEHKSEAHSY